MTKTVSKKKILLHKAAYNCLETWVCTINVLIKGQHKYFQPLTKLSLTSHNLSKKPRTQYNPRLSPLS